MLKTYESERQQVAQDLIAFDHRFSRLFSGRPAKDVMDEEGINMDEFKNAFVKGNMFASGIGKPPSLSNILSLWIIYLMQLLAVDYGTSVIVAKQADGTGASNRVQSKQHLAKAIRIGQRIPSHKVLNQSDARPWHLQELLKSNGRWRVIVFPGNLTNQSNMSRYQELGAKLSRTNSFLRRLTPPGHPVDSIIEVLTVHAGPRWDIELMDLPEVFHPYSRTMGWDYWKVFVDDQSYHEGHGRAYENYGIDPNTGACVIVRPDQYVSWVGDLEDYAAMDEFFSGFMKLQGGQDGGTRIASVL